MGLAGDATDMLREAASSRERTRLPRPPAGASFGFVVPGRIYDRIRALDVKVLALDADVAKNVASDQPFVAKWVAWRKGWEQFRDKTLAASGSWNPLLTGPAVLNTDETSAQVDGYQRDLNYWYEEYKKQPWWRDPGKTVPPPTGPAPGPPPQPGSPQPSGDGRQPSWWESHNPFTKGPSAIVDLVPWWAWVLAIGGAGAAGYVAYRMIKKTSEEAKANADFLRGVALAQMGGSSGGGAGGGERAILQAAQARDYSPAPSVVIHAGGR